MEDVMDEKRICEVDGCGKLSHYNCKNKKTQKVYRSRWCTKHKRLYYKMPTKTGARWNGQNTKKKLIKKFGNICMLCKWHGPCDIHRKIPSSQGGRYSEENSMLICPNCHRLQHPEIFPMYE
jgi:5-methylcytosine-specific restriction endonuclease McrA